MWGQCNLAGAGAQPPSGCAVLPSHQEERPHPWVALSCKREAAEKVRLSSQKKNTGRFFPEQALAN